ncbi:tRNA (5-methylaminomethyl-2-thiouridine)(34)-methyltransferase MnmD [Cytophagaceae bacterium ABcell3]|nr:tRNA (5-methylaminomethyl-2-thiouridine)(34)-methyltransferase MnmD [Cytophagaceae bacterium ABcell3]
MSKIEIISSKDGSHTLFLPEMNETYHSHHGAIQESEYVFIEKGIAPIAQKQKTLTILEIGFGTGLNALLSFRTAIQEGLTLHYHTLEPYPLIKEVYSNLNYPVIIEEGKYKETFLKLHEAPMNEEIKLSNNFFLNKYNETLENVTLRIEADVVFYDAFAPAKQPEVWSLSNLEKVKQAMNPKGVLVTYCASGQFRRDLKSLGFVVENLPGPPGKKEMTRAFLM